MKFDTITTTFLHTHTCVLVSFHFVLLKMAFLADEFEENLIKSIDILLEEKSTQLVEHIQDGVVREVTDVWPAIVPQYTEGNSLLIDGHNYVKWSTVDSDEQTQPKRPECPATFSNIAAANIDGPSMLQYQSQYIAAAMNHRQQLLGQYQSLLYQYQLLRNGQVSSIVDRLMYSINPNYANIGNLLNASTALNWNIAATVNYNNHIKLTNELNGQLMQYNRQLLAGQQKLQMPKNQWLAAAAATPNQWSTK